VSENAPLAPGRSALLERRCTLQPEPQSAGAARRLLREALHEAGREAWRDASELAVSEIVTNAALHAHTPIDLEIRVFDEEVCVAVRDLDPVLPIPRDYEDEATTGRGMGLVAALVRSCGVHPLGSEGKVVWFCVGDEAADPDPTALLERWDVDDDVPLECESVEVVLRSMPATLWLSARQHHDAIVRELVLYLAEHDDLFLDVAAADRARAIVSSTLVREIDRAAQAGRARPALPDGHPSPLPWVPDDLDLVLSVPTDAVGCFAVLQDVLDAAESLAVAGALFTRPGLPEIVAVRDWACEQVIAQAAGSPPAPWPGTAQARFETTVHDRHTARFPDWDSTVVADAPTPVVAADDANRIIAVSRPLASLVGWEVDQLVGRRVVTLVPPRYREAHVAGFSRHLSTGEAHVLGVPVDLPVLTKGGDEVVCRFRIELAPATTGRAVYLAWLDPVEPAGT